MPEELHNTVADLDKIVSLTFLHGKTDGRCLKQLPPV